MDCIRQLVEISESYGTAFMQEFDGFECHVCGVCSLSMRVFRMANGVSSTSAGALRSSNTRDSTPDCQTAQSTAPSLHHDGQHPASMAPHNRHGCDITRVYCACSGSGASCADGTLLGGPWLAAGLQVRGASEGLALERGPTLLLEALCARGDAYRTRRLRVRVVLQKLPLQNVLVLPHAPCTRIRTQEFQSAAESCASDKS